MKKIIFFFGVALLCFFNIAKAQPTINFFTPSAGPIGTMVAIVGSNFNTTPANNIVFFGATKATVSAATTNQLTVTVPYGATYQYISVTNLSTGLTAYSAQPFNTTFICSGVIDAASFTAHTDFPAGTEPRSVFISDMDGDGKSDLAVANYNSNTVSVYKNTSTAGNISFATKVDYTTLANPQSISLGDLDGDGKPDLVVANSGAQKISILKNTSTIGNISFAAKVDYTINKNAWNISIGDIDGDGKPDLAIATGIYNSVVILKNTSTIGTISFAAAISYTTGTWPCGVSMGDLDGDGKPDLAVINVSDNTVSVFKNTSTIGSISFSSRVDYAAGSKPRSISIGDLNGDEKLDIAIANADLAISTVSVLKNTSTIGTISFDTIVDFASGLVPYGVTIGNIDGDEMPDIITANEGANTVSVFKNTSISGSISFAPKMDYSTGTWPYNVSLGDLDGDGKPDLAVSNSTANTISILKNQVPNPPTITSFAPSSGQVGTTVIINGSNFNNTPANNVVFFGATKATVSVADSAQLTVSVPYGATYQNLSVTNMGSNLTAYSAQPFLTTYSGGGLIDTLSFTVKMDYAAGLEPYCVSIGDLNGDGKPDLAVVNYNSNTVSIFKNTSISGFCSFAAKVDYTTGMNPYSISISDINGDGKPDLIIANSGSNTVSAFKNTSTSGVISFAPKVDFTTGDVPFGVAVEDLDGDGKPDIAVANWNANTISVFKNASLNGTISFAAKEDYTTGANPYSIAIGDLDLDGKPDLVVTDWGSDSVSVLKNISTIGNIMFDVKADYLTGDYPQSVSIGDIDGDGKSDLAIANWGSNTLSIFKNTSTSGAISFDSKLDFNTGTFPCSVSIGDLDGEGNADIAVTNWNANAVSVFKNESSVGVISFSPKVDFITGDNPRNISIGDVDGDGKSDLVVANSVSNNISVLSRIGFKPPVISNFSPSYGPVGTSVTIDGNNFNTIPANNIVFFGATKAIVSFASSTQIIATVPYGATFQYFSITDITTNLAAYSLKPFITTFSGGNEINTGSFAEKFDFPSGQEPTGVSICDFDGDGKSDIVVTNNQSDSISVYANTGSYGVVSFATKLDYATGQYPIGICTGDMDGDGKADIAVINSVSNTISVFRNTSTISNISFASKIDFSTGLTPYNVSIGDLDGDGKPDLVVANWNDASISVFKNTSTFGLISFAPKVNYVCESGTIDISIGDLNGDSKPDLAVANYFSNTVSILRNNSTYGLISFAPIVNFPSGARPNNISIGDLDDDGKPDLVTANRDDNTISVFKNISTIGTLSFATKVDYATGVTPYYGTIGDVDGDGNPDIIVANYNSGTVSAFKNISTSGNITFTPGVDVATGLAPDRVSIGDLDGDGESDIVVTNNYGYVSILRNLISFPIIISSFTPTSGPVGTQVTINGHNFNEIPANNIVYFGATKAIVSLASKSQLIVTVPYGATYDFISVTDIDTNLTALSKIPFITTFSCGGYIDTVSFAPDVNLTIGTEPRWVSISDLDGDGKSDLAVVNMLDSAISVFKNSSTSGVTSFSTGVEYATGVFPNRSSIGDLDGDGKPDLTIANSVSNTITIYKNTSTIGLISFSNRIDLLTGLVPEAVSIGDFDDDGKPDLVVTNLSSNTISIYRNTSTTGIISFETKVDYPTGAGPCYVSIGDLNSDGKPDLAVSNSTSSTISVFKNTSIRGEISFAPKVDYATGYSPMSILIGDLNGDEKPELITGNYSANTVSVLKNTSTIGSISFAPKLDFATGTYPMVSMADLDGDGKPDLAVTNETDSTISIFKNTSSLGTISFAAKVDYFTGQYLINLSIGDLDGDEKPDLAVVTRYAGQITIYKNFINLIPNSAGVITGISTVCQSQSGVVYNVPSIANATSYVWNLPSGASGTSSTNNITVNYGTSSVSGNISVYGDNSCGVGVASTLAITVNPKPATPLITLVGNILHSNTSIGNQWYNQSGAIIGATAQDYTVTTNGIYYVMVEINNCSSDTSNKITITNSGIESMEKNYSLKIYPNPVSDELVIQFAGNTNIMNFQIINSLGQVAYFGNLLEKTVVQMKEFPTGVYLIKFENETNVEYKKIIKE